MAPKRSLVPSIKEPAKKAKFHAKRPNFPVQKIFQMMDFMFPEGRVQEESAIYLGAIVEYIAAEILENAANIAQKPGSQDSKITEADIVTLMSIDLELNQLITDP